MKIQGGPNINCNELQAESMTVGERAAFVIRITAALKDIPLSEECENIDARGKTYDDWHKRGKNPSSHYLQQMALAGYDVMWILTGEKYGCEV